MKKRVRVFLGLTMLFFIIINFAYAQEKAALPKKGLFCQDTLEAYQKASMHKLERGLVNTFSFWADLPDELGKVSKEKGILKGSTFGLAQGLLKSTARLILAEVDVATFWLYPAHKPFLEPEYADGKLDAKFREYLW